jgi:hypothetical protein
MTDMKIETVGDIVAILAVPPIGNAMKDCTFAQYYEELSKPRTRGSTSENRLDNIDPFIPLEDVTASITERGLAMTGCTYYRGECVELGGRLGAVTVAEAFEKGWERGIELRKGRHGLELVYYVHGDWAAEINAELDTAEFHVIVGPVPYGIESLYPGIIHTWHPGPVMSNGDDQLTMGSVVKVEVS